MMLRFGNFSSRIAVPKAIALHFRVGLPLGFTSMRPCSFSPQQQQDDPDHFKKLASAFEETARVDDQFFRTPHGVETILDILETAKSPETLISMGSTINTIAWGDEGKKLFTTSRATNVTLDGLSRSTTPESVQQMSEAILWITNNNLKAKKLYSTPEAVKIILEAFTRATAADNAAGMANVVWGIVEENPEGKKVFTIPQTVAAFKSILAFAKDEEGAAFSVECTLKSLVHQNPAAIELFGTQDFLDVFMTMSAINNQEYLEVLATLEAEVNRKHNSVLESSAADPSDAVLRSSTAPVETKLSVSEGDDDQNNNDVDNNDVVKAEPKTTTLQTGEHSLLVDVSKKLDQITLQLRRVEAQQEKSLSVLYCLQRQQAPPSFSRRLLRNLYRWCCLSLVTVTAFFFVLYAVLSLPFPLTRSIVGAVDRKHAE